ncbi:MAG: High-affinity nickel-transporter [Pseudonocardia sp.]
MRYLRRAAAVVLAVAALMLVPVGPTAAPPAQAHPLGNFTVNHYDGLTLHPDRIEVLAVLDSAEVPTLQQRPAVDTDRDGAYSAAEAAAYATAECAALRTGLVALVDGDPVTFTVAAAAAAFPVGEQSLPTTRVTCGLVAPAELARGGDVEFTDTFRADRIGWREITATGSGLRITAADVPAQSTSQQLRSYPTGLLDDPLDQRSARISVIPGSAPGGDGTGVAGSPARPPAPSWLDGLLTSGERFLNGLAAAPSLTPAVGALAVVMSLALGAAHAALPGHGKTVMAAYLAGRQGTRRDALAVGATVTITHTAGVLVFGLLITLVAAFAPEVAMRWLGVVSGLLVAAVGVALLRTAVRRRRELALLPAAERTGVLVGAAVGGGGVLGGHGGHGHGHGHGHGGHRHGHGPDGPGIDRAWSRLGLVGMGVAGGLVPSPTALLVLLAAVEIGRTGFGIGLVLCYALGMAGTLTAAGLLLVSVRDRLARMERTRAWQARGRHLAAALPVATAVLVLVVGLGLALRALAG